LEHTWDIVKTRARISVATKFVRLTTSNWRSIEDIRNVYARTLTEPSDINR